MSEYITLSYNDIRKPITLPSDYEELKNSFFNEFNIKEMECIFKYKDDIDDVIELREDESESDFVEKIEKAKKLKAVIIAEIIQSLDISDNDIKENLKNSAELRIVQGLKENENSEDKQKMEEMEKKIQELTVLNNKLQKNKKETQDKNKILVEERNRYKKIVEENKNEISRLKSKNPNNQQNNEDYENKLKQMEEKVKELESKEEEIKLKNQKIEILNKKLSDNTKDLEDKQKTIDESKIKISSYEEKIKSYEKDINEYKSQLEQSKIEINNLKQNNEQLEKDKIEEDISKQKYEEQIKEEKEKAEKFMNESLELFKKNIENKYKTQYDEKEKAMEEKLSQMSLMINQSKGPNYVHKNIRCEKCLIKPIKGIRYKCSECNNYNLCEKCEEENDQEPFHDEEHTFIKLRKPVDDKEKIYSYDCSNIILLNQFIYEGTEQCEFKILLKNNGNVKWPEKKTKLIFDESSQITGDNITLLSQNVEEEKEYIVNFENLGNLKKGEYKAYLLFNVKGKNIGDKLTLIINVKEKDEMTELEKHKNKIEEFRNTFNLSDEEFSNEKILEILKANNFNFEESFSSLFN